MALLLLTFDAKWRINIHGFNVKSGYILFIVVFTTYFLLRRSAIKGFLRHTFSSGYMLPLGLFALFGFLGLAVSSYYPTKTLAYTLWYIFDVVVLFFFVSFLAKEHEKMSPDKIIILTTTILGIIVIADVIWHYMGMYRCTQYTPQHTECYGLIGRYHPYYTQYHGIPRPQVFFHEPSFLASFLLVGLGLAINNIRSRMNAFALLVISVSLVFVMSRTGWLGIIATVIITAVIHLRRKNYFRLRNLGILVAAIIILSSIGLMLIPKNKLGAIYNVHIDSLRNISFSADYKGPEVIRVRSILKGISVFKDNPIIGSGIGAANSFYEKKKDKSPAVLNMWIEILAETGLVGFTFFAWFYILLFRRLLAKMKKGSDFSRTAGFLTALTVLFFITFQFIETWYRSDLWMITGLLAGYLGCGSSQLPARPIDDSPDTSPR